MRRPVLASDSPRSIRSQSGSTLGRRAHRHRTVPACWRARDVRIRRCWEKSARPEGSARTRTPSLAIFSTPRGTNRDGSTTGTKLRIVAAEACGAVSGQTGTDRVGWYAGPRRTLFATEWSAARRKRPTAAALHLGAQISANMKARPLPTSGRRKFPSGNFRSARDLEVAKRVRRGQAQRANPQPSPFARRPHGTPPPPQPLRSVPVCYNGIEECPH